jgi:hypothetical protein
MSMMSSQIRMLTALGNALVDNASAKVIATAGRPGRLPDQVAIEVLTEIGCACLDAGKALLAEEMALLATIADKPG